MENVTLNQREQARLQVLNGLLADYMTIEQVATLMGLSVWFEVSHHVVWRVKGGATRLLWPVGRLLEYRGGQRRSPGIGR